MSALAMAAWVAHAKPLLPVALEALRRTRLATAHGVMALAEAIGPETISGTSTHKVTGAKQSHVLVVGTSTMENLAALTHATEQARGEVLGIRVPVRVPAVLVDQYDDEEGDLL